MSATREPGGALATAGLLLALAIVIDGGEPGGARGAVQGPMAQRTITEVLHEQTDRLMSVPGVLGIAEGQCDGRPCIKVYVKKKTAQARRKIPSAVEGYPVSIEETDEFRALGR
jgi:hypothetical protein